MHPFCRRIWLEARGKIDPSNPPTDRTPAPVNPEMASDIVGPRLPDELLAVLVGELTAAVVADLRTSHPTS